MQSIVVKLTIRNEKKDMQKIILNDGKMRCFVNNKYCVKTVDIHHIDKNRDNNTVENLVSLCRVHHALADKRGIPIDKLKDIDPSYFVTRKYNAKRYGESLRLKSRTKELINRIDPDYKPFDYKLYNILRKYALSIGVLSEK